MRIPPFFDLLGHERDLRVQLFVPTIEVGKNRLYVGLSTTLSVSRNQDAYTYYWHVTLVVLGFGIGVGKVRSLKK